MKKITWEIKHLYNGSITTISSPSSELLKKLTSLGDLQIVPDITMCGLQMILYFKNGYNLSIIKHNGSYGGFQDKWEIAVMKDGYIKYDTDITSDVLGYLNDEQVAKVAEYAKRMDKDGKLPEGVVIESYL